MSETDKTMSFMSHLTELRTRLIRCFIVLAICTGISFVFASYILDFLIRPAPDDIKLILTEMTAYLYIHMNVALMGGVILAMPVLVYQILMFLSPGLTRNEKKYIYISLPWITIMFVIGIAFAYYVLVPSVAEFLITFHGFDPFGWVDALKVEHTPTLNNYISLVTKFMVAIGISFETPVIITLLARLGIVKPDWLAGKRNWAIVLAFVAAAIITPTFDPINQSLVAVLLVILYEMSIWLAKLVYKKRDEKDYLAD